MAGTMDGMIRDGDGIRPAYIRARCHWAGLGRGPDTATRRGCSIPARLLEYTAGIANPVGSWASGAPSMSLALAQHSWRIHTAACRPHRPSHARTPPQGSSAVSRYL